MAAGLDLERSIADRLRLRNLVCETFFADESRRLAEACLEMATRFGRGGRILAFGRGPYATDAQHVAVEFVHPVIVGKRALPALDLSAGFDRWVPSMVREPDMVMGFGPPAGDPAVEAVLEAAAGSGAMTFGFPSSLEGSFCMPPSDLDPFVHQELVEILYHTLWESVHVFFEHGHRGRDVGQAAFLYPFLADGNGRTATLGQDVAESIRAKVAEDSALRSRLADEQAGTIGKATLAIHERLQAGGKLVVLGNGGSATDANDLVIDCFAPPDGFAPLPAVSLSMEPATITAIANDVGSELVFVRQLIAHGRAEDVLVAISTSGASANVVAALAEARSRDLLTVALLGYDGGEVRRRGLAEHAVVVPSDYIPRIQEVQASVYHVMRHGLEDLLRGG